MSNVEIKVPDIGDAKDVEVIEILVAVGDTIEAEQSLVTLESDKSSMEIPASQGGVVKSIALKVGDKVSEGAVVLVLEEAGDSGAEADATSKDGKKGQADAPTGVNSGESNDEPPVSGGATEGQQAGKARGAEADEGKAEASGAGKSESKSSESGAGAAGELVSVTVPDIGDFADVEVIEVMVAEGDEINAEQSLITVETDKASMEIPASHAGVVKSLKVKVGDKISKGSPILEVQTAGSDSGSRGAAAASAAATPTSKSDGGDAKPAANDAKASSAKDQSGGKSSQSDSGRESPSVSLQDANLAPNKLPHASPSVRKFARELGANLSRINGSGPKSRITADDVRAYVKQALATTQGAAPAASGGSQGADGAALGLLPWPKIDFTKFGEVEAKPLSRIKKISGANLHRNWVMIPHVTNNDVADITDLEALRVSLNKENEKSGIKVTMLAFLIKAVVAALKKFPEFNASLDGDTLVYKHYFHIGFAADTPNGLVVPVIRDADKKGILELAQESSALAKKARDGKLLPAEMQGGCFSISSLGGIGGTSFTPIINAPEVAILGVSRSSHQPVWDGKQFVPRLQLPLSLSYDHRVIDGASAARFNAYLGALLADFRRIAL